MFMKYSLLILSLTPSWWWPTHAIPVSSSPLYGRNEDKVYSLNKLTYSPNEATIPENEDHGYGGGGTIPKSHISDFTDSTGFNPFLDLSEGPASTIRRLNTTLIPEAKYYKYEEGMPGGKDRHSKRDNERSYDHQKNKPLASPAWLLEGEKPRGQRLNVNAGQVYPRNKGTPTTTTTRNGAFARSFVSVVEGESGGRDTRDRFWMSAKLNPKVAKPDFDKNEPDTEITKNKGSDDVLKTETTTSTGVPEVPRGSKPTLHSSTAKTTSTDQLTATRDEDYVTIMIPDGANAKETAEKNVKKIMNVVDNSKGQESEPDNSESQETETEYYFADDKVYHENDDEETNNVNSIATFLETKSFLYSLALICASVVFFAAVLTGMFVYRKKRRRLPGVHKKGGRFYFAKPKNRRGRKNMAEKEERILDDDFRVTVC